MKEERRIGTETESGDNKDEDDQVVPIGPLSVILIYHQRRRRKYEGRSGLQCARCFQGFK